MVKFQLILTSLAVVASVTALDRHKIFYKSLQEAAFECGQYNVQGECLGRCETLITRDWNDTVGMSPVYGRYFQTDPNDQCNVNRTERCLQTKVAPLPPSNSCLRASESVQCYLDQYGQVNTSAPQFVRFTYLQDDQIVSECAAMLGSSFDRVYVALGKFGFQRQITRCVFRCFLIRSGLYSDAEGLNMDRFYVMCGGYNETFYQSVAECTARLRAEVPCADKCTLATRLAVECIGNDYQTGNMVGNYKHKNIQGYSTGPTNVNANNSNVTGNNTQTGNTVSIDNSGSYVNVGGDADYLSNYLYDNYYYSG